MIKIKSTALSATPSKYWKIIGIITNLPTNIPQIDKIDKLEFSGSSLPSAVFALSQLCLKKDRPKLPELELWTEISTLSASNVR